MRLFMGALVLLAVLSGSASVAADAPVAVMVLGTYHFDNPGHDKVNAQIDPVTTPAKQAELEQVAERLARFKPTIVAVERVAKDQNSMLDHRYPDFKPTDLRTNADERVQIAYRLANKLGLKQVYGVDEVEEEGEPEYFPFEPVQKWADTNGKTATIDAMFDPIKAWSAQLEQDQKTRPVGDILAEINDPAHRFPAGGVAEYRLLTLGKGRDLPGADLNARWYARNARIFAKLTQVVRPGDRVLLVYGAGHAYWLRHFASTVPGFKLVEVSDYLRK